MSDNDDILKELRMRVETQERVINEQATTIRFGTEYTEHVVAELHQTVEYAKTRIHEEHLGHCNSCRAKEGLPPVGEMGVEFPEFDEVKETPEWELN